MKSYFSWLNLVHSDKGRMAHSRSTPGTILQRFERTSHPYGVGYQRVSQNSSSIHCPYTGNGMRWPCDQRVVHGPLLFSLTRVVALGKLICFVSYWHRELVSQVFFGHPPYHRHHHYYRFCASVLLRSYRWD